MTKLKLGELFAGYGGLGLAVEEVFDAELAWYAEFDKAPSKIMAHHWPDITNYGDVTTVDWANIPPVDIISGGSPCQDLSLAGARKGMSDGTRSNLWESMREAIATIKPTYVVWENVRGALSAKATSSSDMGQREGFLGERGGHLRALGRVLGDLSDLGYDTQWRGLRAADVGAPHARFRVFVLATRRDAVPDPGSRRRHEAIERQGRGAQGIDGASIPDESDRDAMRPRPIGEAAQDADGAACGERWESAPGQAESGWARADTGGRGGAPTADAERIERKRRGVAGHMGGAARPREADREERERIREATGDSGTGTRPNWGDYAPAIRRWEAVRGTAPAPTELTAKGKHRLSARFAEWMMGVDPGWVTGETEEQWRERITFRRLYGSKLPVGMRESLARRGPFISRNEQLKAIGNGVVPQQAVAALKDMLGDIHAS